MGINKKNIQNIRNFTILCVQLLTEILYKYTTTNNIHARFESKSKCQRINKCSHKLMTRNE